MKLNEFDIYEKSNPKRNELFLSNIDSKLNVDIDINKTEVDFDWIDMILFSIPYVQKALDRPNKQIITEEEIVKIELIKKVTVDSIKHLSKHTNLISEFDPETGDVIPSKILNSFKEESFVTYENRFIYSLILLMGDFLTLKKRKLKQSLSNKNRRKLDYTATTRVGNERVRLESELTLEQIQDKPLNEDEIIKKIAKIEEKIMFLKTTDMFKLLDSLSVTLVKPPIKMTNVLLKNVNFQYALKLWNYLSDNFDAKSKNVKEKKHYDDKGILKGLTDENFLLSYLNCDLIKAPNEIDKEYEIDKQELIKNMTNELISKILELNPDITEMQLREIVAEKYAELRKMNQLNLKKLEEIYRKHINMYMEKIEKKRVN